MIYFLLICIFFFNQLGLLCLCQKVDYRAKREFNNGMESTAMLLLKLSAMWGEKKNVFPGKFAVRGKDYQECLFYVPNYVKCFIK